MTYDYSHLDLYSRMYPSFEEIEEYFEKDARAYLKITYELLKGTPLVPAGHVLGFDEILLANEDGRNQTAVRWLKQETDADAAVGVAETDGEVIIKGKGFVYVYSKKKGLFESMNYAGREYLDSPMELNIWGAPTDNDMYVKHEWNKAQYRRACPRAYVTVVEPSKDGVVISSILSVSAASLQRMMDIKAVWTVDNNGDIYSSLEVARNFSTM